MLWAISRRILESCQSLLSDLRWFRLVHFSSFLFLFPFIIAGSLFEDLCFAFGLLLFGGRSRSWTCRIAGSRRRCLCSCRVISATFRRRLRSWGSGRFWRWACLGWCFCNPEVSSVRFRSPLVESLELFYRRTWKAWFSFLLEEFGWFPLCALPHIWFGSSLFRLESNRPASMDSPYKSLHDCDRYPSLEFLEQAHRFWHLLGLLSSDHDIFYQPLF